jgi:hypothetical protein
MGWGIATSSKSIKISQKLSFNGNFKNTVFYLRFELRHFKKRIDILILILKKGMILYVPDLIKYIICKSN